MSILSCDATIDVVLVAMQRDWSDEVTTNANWREVNCE